MGLTKALATRIFDLQFGNIPERAVETVKRGMIDCAGVLFAGKAEGVTKIILSSIPAGEEATVLFEKRKARSADAALVNAVAAHALDYDDTGIDGHPSVVLAPTVLAEGERLGASGKEAIAAYVCGYETWGELVGRDADRHHGKGWHPTAVFGTVGAAAAAARLARLSAEKTAHALGIAASMAGGLVANFGSMTKPFQAGRAAQSGITAARLAAAGLTASADALEHPSGFLAAFSPRGDVRLDERLGDWHILKYGLNVKRYPVCYGVHRAIDAVLALGADPAKVGSVEVRVGKLQGTMLRNHSPQTGLEAKFSAEFAMASALLRRRVGLGELRDDFVRSQPVQELMRKVRVNANSEPDPEEPLFSRFDEVLLAMKDGSTLASPQVRHPRGHARNPLTLEELRVKFDDCTGGRQGPLFECLLSLEKVDKLPLHP